MTLTMLSIYPTFHAKMKIENRQIPLPHPIWLGSIRMKWTLEYREVASSCRLKLLSKWGWCTRIGQCWSVVVCGLVMTAVLLLHRLSWLRIPGGHMSSITQHPPLPEVNCISQYLRLTVNTISSMQKNPLWKSYDLPQILRTFLVVFRR